MLHNSDEHLSDAKTVTINASRLYDFSIDSTGTYAALGGRREIIVVNLENEAERKRHTFQAKWETYHVQWNPHSVYQTMFASARNNRVEIWQWDGGTIKDPLHTLSGHARSISALDWSPFAPNCLATACVDGSRGIFIWDIRDTKKQMLTFESLTGISQLRWNKMSDFVFASSHESEVRVWDTRKGSSPIQFISGHTSKVYDLDWFGGSEDELVTGSQDCKIKVWHLNEPKHAFMECSTLPNPVYRVRYTPFGHALVSIATPHHRKDLAVTLWLSVQEVTGAPLRYLHSFVGHKDVLLSVGWRRQPQKPPEEQYQLVTLSRDSCLRFWPIDSRLMQICGGDSDIVPDICDSEIVGSAPTDSTRLNTESLSSSGSGTQDLVAACDLPLATTVTHATDDEMVVPEDMAAVLQPLQLPLPGSTPPLQMRTSSSLTPGPPSSGVQGVPIGIPPSIKRSISLAGPVRASVSLSLQAEMESLEKFQLSSTTALKVEQADAVNRQCVVTVSYGHLVVRLQVTFPTGYPHAAPPVFKFLQPSAEHCHTGMLRALAKKMDACARRQMQFGGQCSVMACLQLVEEEMVAWQEPLPPPDTGLDIDNAVVSGQHRSNYQYHQFDGLLKLDQLGDRRVPFPRTSGARFSINGVLLVFRRPSYTWSGRSVGAGGSSVITNKCPPELTPKSFRDLTMTKQSDFHVVGGDASPPGFNYHTRHLRAYPYQRQISAVPVSNQLENVSISDYYRKKDMQHHWNKREQHQQKRRGHAIQRQVTCGPVLDTSSRADNRSAAGSSDLALSSNSTQLQTLVVLYDASPLMPLDLSLAESYSMDTDDLETMCISNSKAAAMAGRADLVQMWRLLAAMSNQRLLPSRTLGALPPWAALPFGRSLIHTWVTAAQRIVDLQTLGMLALTLSALDERWSTALSDTPESVNLPPRVNDLPAPAAAAGNRAAIYQDEETMYNPYHTVTLTDLNRRAWLAGIQQHFSRPRSNSCNGAFDEIDSVMESSGLQQNGRDFFPVESTVQTHLEESRLLDAPLRSLCDLYLRMYGEVLYTWGLLTARARLMKALSPAAARATGQQLAGTSPTPVGDSDSKKLLRCALCSLPVRGLASLCAQCQHGGHPEHVRDWFAAGHDGCPAACGCQCTM